MKVALAGASGNAGSRILAELTSRGHAVTGLARHPETIADAPGVTKVAVDAGDAEALADALKGHDAVISALPFKSTDPETLIGAVKASGVPRYLVVGGAASLYLPGTKTRIIDSGQIPEAWLPEVNGGVAFLDALKASDGLDWTFLSPSMFFGPGERTGKFRLGEDELLVGPEEKSSISYEDLAIALVDELETPTHSGRRFTVGY